MLELDVTLQRMEGRRVLVVGDVICDYYVYGVAERISREAPVLILRYEGDAVHPGGAANAACNVRSLGGRALLVGALGRDALGRRVLQSLRALGLDTDAVVVDRDGSTAVKTRILAGARQALRQQVVRVDRAGPPSLPHAVEERLLALLTTHIGDCDAVLIADYGLGTVTPRLAAAALSLARRHGRPVAVDSRHRLLSFGGVDVATPNKVEAEEALGVTFHTEAELLAGGEELRRRLASRALVLTRGEEGMTLFEAGRPPLHIPVLAPSDVFDVTGAGDTVTAALTLALAAGASFPTAAVLANAAAGVAVTKPGAATVNREEVTAALRRWRPSLLAVAAEDWRGAGTGWG